MAERLRRAGSVVVATDTLRVIASGRSGKQRHELVLMSPIALAGVPEQSQRLRKRDVHPGDEQRCQQGCGNVRVQHQIRGVPGRNGRRRGELPKLPSRRCMLMLGRRDSREGPGEPVEGEMQNLLGHAAENEQ